VTRVPAMARPAGFSAPPPALNRVATGRSLRATSHRTLFLQALPR